MPMTEVVWAVGIAAALVCFLGAFLLPDEPSAPPRSSLDL